MSRQARLSFGLALLLAIGTTAFAQDVKTDYARGTDFSQFKTFMWIKEPQTTNPLTKQRVIDDVNAALTAKGLQLVTGNADLCIAAHAATKQNQTLNTFYNGFGGGWRWGGGFGDATTTVDNYKVGTLVVDLFDANSKNLIWRGSASDTLSNKSDKNIKELDKGVEKMFAHFPPEPKR